MLLRVWDPEGLCPGSHPSLPLARACHLVPLDLPSSAPEVVMNENDAYQAGSRLWHLQIHYTTLMR